MEPASRFYAIGLGIAALEEFISQGVLKHSLGGWIISTLIAFLPFLVIVRAVGRFVHRRFDEQQSALVYYLLAGGSVWASSRSFFRALNAGRSEKNRRSAPR